MAPIRPPRARPTAARSRSPRRPRSSTAPGTRAGNVEATNSRLIDVNTAPTDTTPPATSIACNGGGCSAGWYAAPVDVSLSATDAGSGVDVIRYTVDGSDPTASSPSYSGPFTVSTTTTVNYRAWDTAGNVEATKTQRIQMDTVAPTVVIASPANGATRERKHQGRCLARRCEQRHRLRRLLS